MIYIISNTLGHMAGHFIKGILYGAGGMLGAVAMWGYLGGVHP